MNILAIAFATVVAVHPTLTPCTGIEMPTTPDWPQVQKIIARQLNARTVEPLRTAVFGAWRVFDVSANDSEVLVAFQGGQVRPPYVIGNFWNGADSPPSSSREGIRKWALEKAPGIPPRLVDCLVLHTMTRKK